MTLKLSLKTLSFSVLLLCSISGIAQENTDQSKPLVLKSIMTELGQNMQEITAGISREDWSLVESASTKIANHPQPHISEKLRIASFMKEKMATFKSLDDDTHHAASKLLLITKSKDGERIIEGFSRLQTTCLACHQAFRETFQKHYYKK